MDLYLYEDILKAKNQDDLLVKTQRVVEKLEYETFLYGFRYVEPSVSENKLTDCIFGTYPEKWRERYIEMEYEAIDPTIPHCSMSTTPVVWTHSYFSAPKVIDMHMECAGTGVAGGTTIPIHGSWHAGGGGGYSVWPAPKIPTSLYRIPLKPWAPACCWPVMSMRRYGASASPIWRKTLQ